MATTSNPLSRRPGFSPGRCGNARTVILAVVGWLMLTGTPTLSAQTGEPSFPYPALISAPEALVHSGPGTVHYGTQRLQPGDAIEVYRHDPGGWCAIRPPQGSFSVLPESQIKMVREGVGEIQSDGTPVFVGTRLGPVENPLWQVKLRAGEQVAVLGQLSWPSAAGHSTVWYQIQPPAGEFRWIHQSQFQPLSNSVPTEEAETGTPRPSPDRQSRNVPDPLNAPNLVIGSGLKDPPPTGTHASPNAIRDPQVAIGSTLPTEVVRQADARLPIESDSTDIQLAAYGQTPAPNPAIQEPQDRTGINQGWRRSRRAEREAGQSGTDSYLSQSANQPVPRRQAPVPLRTADAQPGSSALAAQLDRARNGWGSEPQGYRPATATVGELELRLTEEMLKPDPGEWQLLELEQIANQLVQAASSDTMPAANRVLEKIKSCQRLQAGYQNRPSVGQSRTYTSNPMANLGSAESNNGVTDSFDAVGWLNELTRQHGTERPVLVLLDETGAITHLIEPIPGLNLQRYLKKKIGVTGKRGFHQQLQLNHIRVDRAFPL